MRQRCMICNKGAEDGKSVSLHEGDWYCDECYGQEEGEMAKGIKRKLNTAIRSANKEIAGIASRGGMYAGALSSEGYAGGYRDALDDVILALNGCKPNNRFWVETEFEDY